MKHIRATLALGNSRTETVAFPCADSKIKQMLAHRTDDDKYTVYVDELTEPSWMKPIEKTDVNIHELNYLAKRMDAMDDAELAKMGAALSRFGVSDLSQSINYTFNLNCITLVGTFPTCKRLVPCTTWKRTAAAAHQRNTTTRNGQPRRGSCWSEETES